MLAPGQSSHPESSVPGIAAPWRGSLWPWGGRGAGNPRHIVRPPSYSPLRRLSLASIRARRTRRLASRCHSGIPNAGDHRSSRVPPTFISSPSDTPGRIFARRAVADLLRAQLRHARPFVLQTRAAIPPGVLKRASSTWVVQIIDSLLDCASSAGRHQKGTGSSTRASRSLRSRGPRSSWSRAVGYCAPVRQRIGCAPRPSRLRSEPVDGFAGSRRRTGRLSSGASRDRRRERPPRIHAGAPEEGLQVLIVIGSFRGLALLGRQRACTRRSATRADGVHALGLETLTPEEWERRGSSAMKGDVRGGISWGWPGARRLRRAARRLLISGAWAPLPQWARPTGRFFFVHGGRRTRTVGSRLARPSPPSSRPRGSTAGPW